MRRLTELNNKSALARDLGISPQAVAKRLLKLDPDGTRLQSAMSAGGAAAIVHQAFSVKQDDVVVSVGFEAGATTTAKHYMVLERLSKNGDFLDVLIGQLQLEIAEQMSGPKAKLKPYHIELACKLIGKSTALAEVVHRIYKDIASVEAFQQFSESTVRIMAKYDPEVQLSIYRELMQLGAHEQAELYSVK